jgi:hypothetical protein
MLFLAELSEALRAPSEFRLLNGADPIIVGMGDDRGESLKFLKEVLLPELVRVGLRWLRACFLLCNMNQHSCLQCRDGECGFAVLTDTLSCVLCTSRRRLWRTRQRDRRRCAHS